MKNFLTHIWIHSYQWLNKQSTWVRFSASSNMGSFQNLMNGRKELYETKPITKPSRCCLFTFHLRLTRLHCVLIIFLETREFKRLRICKTNFRNLLPIFIVCQVQVQLGSHRLFYSWGWSHIFCDYYLEHFASNKSITSI